ncbi:MAG: LysR family transcriptional regulator, low CO2-responsive transcriptional regulator [Ilumatobacteraceae bacterium]
MTLAQLKVFVLVSRLGSVRAAAAALGVSEPAVSQALAALRQHLDDPLITRSGSGMELTPAGRRVVSIASQMVNLAVDAEVAVRQSNGAAELLRVVTTSTLSQSIVPALLQAFTARAGGIEVSLGVATTEEMAALIQERLADIAVGPRLPGMEAEAVMRYRMTLVGHPDLRLDGGGLSGMRWLVDPTGTDALSDVGGLLTKYRVPESRIRVFANEKAAWSAAAAGEGVAPAIDHMVTAEVDRGALAKVRAPDMPLDLLLYVSSLESQRRSNAADRLRRFVRTPDAMQAMYRPDIGVPVAKFRPPVYVTLWS